jgi:hypothetical protein
MKKNKFELTYVNPLTLRPWTYDWDNPIKKMIKNTYEDQFLLNQMLKDDNEKKNQILKKT